MRSKSRVNRFAAWASGQPVGAVLALGGVLLVVGVLTYRATFREVAGNGRSDSVNLAVYLGVVVVPLVAAVTGLLVGLRHGWRTQRRILVAVLFGALWFVLAAVAVRALRYGFLIVSVLLWAAAR